MHLKWETTDWDRMYWIISEQNLAIGMGEGFPEKSNAEYCVKSINCQLY